MAISRTSHLKWLEKTIKIAAFQDDFTELKVNIVRFLKENNRVINL